MILKKHKAVIAALISAAMTAAAIAPTVVSAAGTRTKEEKFGDKTYAERFLSLYDDVITNGETNGYLSKNNKGNGDSFGVPYHSVEELCIEAPDYGHETTSEAMSYIVWMAAMRDNIAKKLDNVDDSNDLIKAWRTMEVMIPGQVTGIQTGMMSNSTPSATYSPEWDEPKTYTDSGVSMENGNNGLNPIHKYFTTAYQGDKGLYLMHWLADVDDWYGYGGGQGKFTFINTFQRGSQESCWETVPHPSIEEKKYGNSTAGIKGIFKDQEENKNLAEQWAYTNAPDAEDRAIQAVFAANRWGVGNSEINALAGKMGDQLRNNFFDKYYKKIGANSKEDRANDMSGAHFLRSWYTSWGGAINGDWTWQIGASHCHEFYQNPLAAFGLLSDKNLTSNMKAQDAVKDYTTSLQRQLEYYLWLQSAEGPIAGGSTSSWRGRYLEPKYEGTEQIAHFGSATPTTFYGMSYVEHPVYEDPGSNHWIGNQVWAVQRLAELYYVVKTEGDSTGVMPGGLSIEDALKAILDRWVEWFIGEVELSEDGDFAIPANIDWTGQPADWNNKYNPNANANLHATVRNYGSTDLGCVSSLANTLIYYAKANNVDPSAAAKDDNADLAGQALYTAHELLCREWDIARDDIGLSRTEHNGSMRRLFEQDVFIPTYYHGTMPNGDPLENGATFLSFRSQYLQNEKVQEYKAAYDAAKGQGTDAINEAMESVDITLHRFWHAGDILLAMGTMYELYPEVTPDKRANQTDPPIPTDKPQPSTSNTNPTPPNPSNNTDNTSDTGNIDGARWGDTNVDGDVNIADVVKLNLYLLDGKANPLEKQGYINANVQYDDYVDLADAAFLMSYTVETIAYDKLGPQK